eukprot:TRINITY_DN10394_c0_g1_i1.p1 TRINITY_DN10394_c0_g1~~TRINITY_DN10394_c0_g1_i1.p1  ORF type:complete len:564 (+),score=101.57 TRINITY_DN10394_c0_g1_i1:358-2049(+)
MRCTLQLVQRLATTSSRLLCSPQNLQSLELFAGSRPFTTYRLTSFSSRKQVAHSYAVRSQMSIATATKSGTEAGVSALKNVRTSGLLKEKALIDGKWVQSDEGETFSVTNPCTNETLAVLPHMGYEETARAIKAAGEAFKLWSALTAKERSTHLRKWYNLITEERLPLAQLMTLEQGKPLKESLAEVDYGAGYVEFYAEEAKRAYGDVLPSPFKDRQIIVLRQPVGVVGVITPWNFPVAMITRKIAPALAAGCTVVIKPAELTPLCALALGELAQQAGIPDGVVNVVVGDSKPIGNALMDSDIVAKLSFTGSTAVGKLLMAAAAKSVKKVALELGGNAPFIVFDDANVKLAAKGALAAKFRNMGQTCVCVNRFLVQDGVYDEFVAAFLKEVASLKVGNGLDEGVTQGPLINEKAVEKVHRIVEDAVSKGAKVLIGGKKHELDGTFYEPTVLGEATTDMIIHREEVFGPVAPIFRFRTEEEAIRLANDTEFGLASYLYTENIARGWRVSEALQYGMVGFNESAISTEFAPFGGIKQSGHGREGSKYGLEDYMEMKYMCMGNLTK